MQVVLKWAAQFLLLPLLKEFAEWAYRKAIRKKENDVLKRENQAKQEAYDLATDIEQAKTEFEKLP